MIKNIILSAGHTNVPGRDQGATGNGYVEGQLAVEFRQLVANYIGKMGIKPMMDGNNTILAESLSYFKKMVKDDNNLAVEFHWNSAESAATGTEVLVPATPSPEEKAMAADLSKVVAATLKITNRGVKTELQSHHGKLGWMTLPGTNILMEICFVSNAIDMENYQENKFKLAENVAKVIFNYANGVKGMTNVDVITEIPFVPYEVKTGDTLSTVATIYGTTVEKIMQDNSITNPNLIHIGQTLKIYNS